MIEIPEENSQWRHKGGGHYQVIIVTNKNSDRLEEYPITVVYRRLIDNTVWSRPLSRWHGSMTFIPQMSAKEIMTKLDARGGFED